MASEDAWAAEREGFVEDNTDSDGAGMSAPTVEPSGQHPSAQGSGALLGAQFAQLARQLFDADSTDVMLQRIVSAVTQVVPGAELVSLTLRDQREQLTTPVHTNELAARLDTLQYTHHEGPCVSATLEGGLGESCSPDLTRDTQWPAWSPAAVSEGVSSVLAAGLFPDSPPPRLGSINCYGMSPNQVAHGAGERDAMWVLAAHVSTVLAMRQSLDTAEHEVAGLRQALHTRDVIGQAKGILMGRRGLSAGQAFDKLREASQALNRKLADVAVDLTQYPNRLL